jgi:hypothetical protein
MLRGYEKPLFIQPFDHRESFQTKLFGWKGGLIAQQTAEVIAAKLVIYDGFQAAIARGVQKEHAGILVDEQFGAAVLCDAARRGYITACPVEKTATSASLFSTSVFLAGGIIGTFHHLYFAGTPSVVMALGATFSALEVVPLVLIGFEAWENIRLTRLRVSSAFRP